MRSVVWLVIVVLVAGIAAAAGVVLVTSIVLLVLRQRILLVRRFACFFASILLDASFLDFILWFTPVGSPGLRGAVASRDAIVAGKKRRNASCRKKRDHTSSSSIKRTLATTTSRLRISRSVRGRMRDIL